LEKGKATIDRDSSHVSSGQLYNEPSAMDFKRIWLEFLQE